MQNVDHIICGDYVIPMDESLNVIKDGAVATKSDKIVEVGTSQEILNKYRPVNIAKERGR